MWTLPWLGHTGTQPGGLKKGVFHPSDEALGPTAQEARASHRRPRLQLPILPQAAERAWHRAQYPRAARPAQGTTGAAGTTYQRRNVVERCVGRLKQWRRVAPRYEKRAVNYRAVVVIAALII